MRDDVVRHIERSLLGDTLEEDGSIGEVEVKCSILLEDWPEVSQDLKLILAFMSPSSASAGARACGYFCERTSP